MNDQVVGFKRTNSCMDKVVLLSGLVKERCKSSSAFVIYALS